MTAVVFERVDGTRQEVHVENGTTVMQAAVDNMIDGILGDCGGACSCATCHCYVDEDWFDKVGGPGDMEKELLACASNPEHNSRLSCQIVINEEMDGVVIKLPESQF